jgi:hypothetical protein
MILLSRWEHKDGSVVEFSEQGWRSDDPKKSACLVKMSEVCGSYPVVAPAIRIWLQENCQLVEFTEPEDAVKSIGVPHHSGAELGKLQALGRAVNDGISPNIPERFK